jgi:hypothetical protein
MRPLIYSYFIRSFLYTLTLLGHSKILTYSYFIRSFLYILTLLGHSKILIYSYFIRSFFVARGPAFKKNYTSPPINATDVYSVLCKIFGIEGSPNNGSNIVTKDFFVE